jgi:long-chain acyl-CoA synthetase
LTKPCPAHLPELLNLAQLVFDWAKSQPDKTALLCRSGSLTYAELAKRVRGMAGALAHLGLQTGDKVALLLYNTQAFAISYFALLSLGVTVVPLNTRLTTAELEIILNDAEARLLVTSLEFYETVVRLNTVSLEGVILDTELLDSEEVLDQLLNSFPLERALYRLDDLVARNYTLENPLPYDLPSDTLAALIYTSGTTGKPKGVMLSHHNILADAQANVTVIEATPDDRFVTISPLFHVFGQTNILVSAM